MAKASLETLFSHTADAYGKNLKLILFFSIPFLFALPLASLLPTFVAAGGIFLRFNSVPGDFDLVKLAIISGAFLVSLLLASFAVASINIVVRSQRTLTKLTQYEIERIEHATFRLFTLLLLATLVIFAANLVLVDLYANFGGKLIPLQPVLGSLIAFLVSLAVLFAPQAIAIDDTPLSKTVLRSFGVFRHKPAFYLFFLFFAGLLLLLSDFFFLSYFPNQARLLTLVANALLFLPFLEAFKTQIYLSKYTLI